MKSTKKDLKTQLTHRKIKKPNPILMSIGMGVLGMLNRSYGVKFSYDYDRKLIKGKPVILLSSHSSRLEFIYTVYGFGRKDINVVCGFQNILKKGVYRLMMKLGVISKYLYQPDVMCVKNMLSVLHRNGALGLFPEGIQSTSGSTHPINPATAQLIKSSKAYIVACTSEGAYLATNRYSPDRKCGYIGIKYSLLFTPEQLEELSEDEIYREILDKISYNDFAFNKTARHKYVGKKPNADGIDKILYKCPDCKAEHRLHVEGDRLVCESWGFEVRINEYYDLVDVKGNGCPADIDKWYKWQRSCVSREIVNDGFEMTLQGTLCTLDLEKLKKPPENRKTVAVGTARLTNRGLTFSGALGTESVELEFAAKSVYSLTYSTKGFLEFYYKNDYFMLVPEGDSARGLIKWTLAAEEIHNLYDERWRSACADVYGIEGEENE